MNRDKERAIEWDCQQVLQQFFRYIDQRQYKKLVDLFTLDGVWIRLGEVLTGHQELYRAMEARPTKALSCHVLSNVLVTVHDHSHADAVSCLSIYRHEMGETLTKPIPLEGPKWVSIYNDSFLLTPVGWRIERKEGHTLFSR